MVSKEKRTILFWVFSWQTALSALATLGHPLLCWLHNILDSQKVLDSLLLVLQIRPHWMLWSSCSFWKGKQQNYATDCSNGSWLQFLRQGPVFLGQEVGPGQLGLQGSWLGLLGLGLPGLQEVVAQAISPFRESGRCGL